MQNTSEPFVGKRQTTEAGDTDEERAFRLKARTWMAGRLPERVVGEPANAFENVALVERDRKVQRVLWDGGLAGIAVPREYGGLGFNAHFETIFSEEAEPYRLAWHFGNAFNIVLPTLLAHGSEDQKRRYIPAMLKGEQLWCQLLSEPSGGSDVAGLLTRAERKEGKWVLNGSKVWTSGGHVADMGLCLARTDPTVPKHNGLTMFLVNMHSPGMTIKPIRLVKGGADFCQEFLDDVEVPDEDVVGAVNAGWKVAGTQLAAERAGMARGWHFGLRPAAVAEHIYPAQPYIDRVRELGRADDPVARQLIGEIIVNDAVYNLTVQRVTSGMGSGKLAATAGALSSLLAARTANRRTALLSQLSGPAGVAVAVGQGGPETGLDRVTTHRIGGGTLEMQLNLVAERHLGLPREPGYDRTLPFNQIRNNAVTINAEVGGDVRNTTV